MEEEIFMAIKPGDARIKTVRKYVKNELKDAGFEIVESGFYQYDGASADKHYAHLVKEPFYPSIKGYMTSDVCFGMIVKGENAIEVIHNEMVGSTKNPKPGTMRYEIPKMLGREPQVTANVIHSSDSEAAAELEIGIFRERRQAYVEEHGADYKPSDINPAEADPELAM